MFVSLKNSYVGPGVVTHAYNPSTEEAEQEITNSRPAWATQWNHVSKTTYVVIQPPPPPASGNRMGLWWGSEGVTFLNGISTLIKETSEIPLPSAMWGYSQKTLLSQEQGPLQTLKLLVPCFDLPTSRTVRNKLPLFINHPHYGILF
jgi:hypothetical protein